MFVNAAYLHDHTPAVVDMSRPLVVTSCGNYRLIKRAALETKRPFGRKDFQLLYVASGRAFFEVGKKEYELSAGSVVIYRPDEPQYYIYYAKDKPDIYWAHFTGAKAENFLPKESVLRTGTAPELQWLFEQIITELLLCRPKYEEITALVLQNILLLISRYAENEDLSVGAEQEMIKAMHYFKNNYKEEINIEKYAADCNYSLSWFIKCFKRITGKTPLQYILAQRTANAKSLLEHTDSPVREIAESVGYENALYFSRVFRKQTGLSPTEYRKIVRG